MIKTIQLNNLCNTIEQSGGRFIGKGAYGCVFRPAYFINKIGIVRRKKEYISKFLFYESSAKLEFEQNKIVKQLDPTRIFTLPMYGMYKFNKLILQSIIISGMETKKQFGKCQLRKNKLSDVENVWNIVVKDGGQTIGNTIREFNTNKEYYISTIDNLYYSFGEIFEGLKIMNSKQFIHNDIKSDNITFDGKKSYLIDFGLSTSCEKEIDNIEWIEIIIRSVIENKNPEQILANHSKKVAIYKPFEYYMLYLLFYSSNDPRIVCLEYNFVLIRFIIASYPDLKPSQVIEYLKQYKKTLIGFIKQIEYLKTRKFNFKIDHIDMSMNFNEFLSVLKLTLINDDDIHLDQCSAYLHYLHHFTHTEIIKNIVKYVMEKIDMFGIGRIIGKIVLMDKKILFELIDTKSPLINDTILVERRQQIQRFTKTHKCMTEFNPEKRHIPID
jgi:serine/threonine protein kinase